MQTPDIPHLMPRPVDAGRRRFQTAALGLGLGGLRGALGALPEAPPLDTLARAKGLRFGTAIGRGSRLRASGFADPTYRALIARECGVLVLENESKWPQLRPDPRQPYRFEAADEMLAWAHSAGLGVRGHTLLWMPDQWLPGWVSGEVATRPAREVAELVQAHVRQTCTHFGEVIESWDVVNEAVDPASGALRDNALSERLSGPVELIDLAFRAAQQHAPRAQRVYNDFMDWGEAGAAHRQGVLRLLTELRRRGSPVQALGIQGHISATPGLSGEAATARASDWRRFLGEVMALDLDLLVTEFDVHDRALPDPIEARDAGVAAAARDWLDATLDAPRLRRLLCWGLADPFSWLQEEPPVRASGAARRPLPFDAALRPKPLRAAIAAALAAAPER